MDNNVDALLKQAVNHGASDIHLKVGSAPIVRIDGELRRIDGYDPLTPTDTEAFAKALFTERAAADFAESGSTDFAYGRHELGRFRATAFRQRGSVSLVLRRVVPGSKSFSELGLPKAMERIAVAMPAQFSSTAQDMARGKRSEIDHLNGKLFFERLGMLKRDLIKRKIRKEIREGTW